MDIKVDNNETLCHGLCERGRNSRYFEAAYVLQIHARTMEC